MLLKSEGDHVLFISDYLETRAKVTHNFVMILCLIVLLQDWFQIYGQKSPFQIQQSSPRIKITAFPNHNRFSISNDNKINLCLHDFTSSCSLYTTPHQQINGSRLQKSKLRGKKNHTAKFSWGFQRKFYLQIWLSNHFSAISE